jgi:ADP-ribosylglycohydrolase
MHPELNARERAFLSLDGLSVGDALGERFFGPPAEAVRRISAREVPPGPWRYTDDTEMALSIVEVLLQRDVLDPDRLASRFAQRYDPSRGYGGGAHGLLQSYRRGVPWQRGAPALFGGTGSFGNGSAMRVAPLGAYLADDLDAVTAQAERSAAVTHAHPEGKAGAIAVAVGAATAYQQSVAGSLDAAPLFAQVLARTPEGATRQRIEKAAALPASTPSDRVAGQLGSGQEVSCQDTVPFVIWCAAHTLGDYEAAFWKTVSGLGDRDTTCAMVGGIVALSSRSIPPAWLAAREPLPELGPHEE